MNLKHSPYHSPSYRVYFAIIEQLGIKDECVEPNPYNKGGTRDTSKGAALYTTIYEILKSVKE